jgi:hypothetical protein
MRRSLSACPAFSPDVVSSGNKPDTTLPVIGKNAALPHTRDGGLFCIA